MQIGKHLRTLEYVVKREQQLFERNVGQLSDDLTFWRFSVDHKSISFEPRQVANILSSLFKALVFLQSTNQFGTRIVLVVVFHLGPRQQHARFNLCEHGRHQQILAGQFELQLFHDFDVLHILFGDFSDRDIEHIDILAPDQVKKQIQRPLKRLQKYLQRIRWDVEILRKRGYRLAIDNGERHFRLGRTLLFVLRRFGRIFWRQDFEIRFHGASAAISEHSSAICA